MFDDIEIDAVKIGMVSSIEIIDVIAECLRERSPAYVVIDPVMVSKSGSHLLKPKAKDELIKVLLPLADVVTPNLAEAEEITGKKITNIDEMKKAALMISEMGAKSVVVTGGHLKGDAVDVLYTEEIYHCLEKKRINTKNTHGTGCTFSSAIAAYLARGCSVFEAVIQAKDYITEAIAHALDIGHGVGPTNHFYDLYHRAGVLDVG